MKPYKLHKWQARLYQVLDMANRAAWRERSDVEDIEFIGLREGGALYLLTCKFSSEKEERLIPWERLWEQASE